MKKIQIMYDFSFIPWIKLIIIINDNKKKKKSYQDINN